MNAMIDALMATHKGKTLYVQAKTTIAERTKELKDLTHFTFVEYPQMNNGVVRFDVYKESKARIRQLAKVGGYEYGETLLAVQYARTSQQAYDDAIDMLIDRHPVHDYESSDSYQRY